MADEEEPGPPQCPYERLGLDSSCTDEDIRRAYRRQALLHHPDRHEEENREEASERFRHALEAYEKLNHPDKRKAYDQSVLNERYSSSPFESPFYDDDEGFVSFRRNMKPTRFSSNVHRRGTRPRQSGHASAFDLFDQMHSRHSNIFPSSMFNDESSFGFSNMGFLLMDEIMRDFDEDFNDLMGDTSAFSGHSFFNHTAFSLRNPSLPNTAPSVSVRSYSVTDSNGHTFTRREKSTRRLSGRSDTIREGFMNTAPLSGRRTSRRFVGNSHH